jgi:hypothetical protein
VNEVTLSKKMTRLSTSIAAVILLLVFTMPVLLTLGQSNHSSTSLKVNAEASNIILYKKGYLESNGGLGDFDSFKVNLKAGKEYVFYARVNIPAGLFNLLVTGPGGNDGDTETWDETDPKSARVLKFYFIPSDSGEHDLVMSGTGFSADSTYRIYFNRAGFAGWWWMLLAGIGALAILVLIIFGITKLFRKKKKKKRRR